MPLRSKAIEVGIFHSSDLDLLARVMEKTEVAGESEELRSARASRIISYFQMGLTDEDELVTLAKQPLGR